jgi:2-methylcitrate synthase
MSAGKSGAGLAGVTAGETAICTVGKEGAGLTYRGYTIEDLVAHSNFEEVAYLLIHGKLPTPDQLTAYRERLIGLRGLPRALCNALESIPRHTHPMDVMRTGCSLLGNLEPEIEFSAQHDAADRLLAVFPSIVLYWYRFHRDRVRIDTATQASTTAGHFLELLRGAAPDVDESKALDTTLMLYAEHEFNASTFTARVIAATLSDFHSAITGAIGALRGPLHGGANEAAMELIRKFSTPESAVAGIDEMLATKQLVMGFGHRVYKTSDPRNAINKAIAEALARKVGDTVIFPVSEAIERVMWERKKLFANADFYSAGIYHFLGIPTALFTPLFVCSRITGWSAHVFEQRANNRLIRPAAEYVGPPVQPWVSIEARG